MRPKRLSMSAAIRVTAEAFIRSPGLTTAVPPARLIVAATVSSGSLRRPVSTTAVEAAATVADVAEVWRRGSVVGSWLLDLAAIALAKSPDLAEFSGRVSDSGEGRWTIMAAIEEAVPCEVLTSALYSRFRSRQDHTFAEKVCSAMRYQFGGHLERPAGG